MPPEVQSRVCHLYNHHLSYLQIHQGRSTDKQERSLSVRFLLLDCVINISGIGKDPLRATVDGTAEPAGLTAPDGVPGPDGLPSPDGLPGGHRLPEPQYEDLRHQQPPWASQHAPTAAVLPPTSQKTPQSGEYSSRL